MLSESPIMIQLLLAFLAAWGPHTDDLARGARRTAPSYLTDEAAHEHAFAAVVAGEIYQIDPALLLSIAWHESRYSVSAVTHEPGGKTSCGVMTPVPLDHCSRDSSLVESYLRGAEHLATWMRVERGDLRRSLWGYAGGGRLIRFCLDGGDSRGCRVPKVFLDRAAQIARNVGPSV